MNVYFKISPIMQVFLVTYSLMVTWTGYIIQAVRD